MFSTWLPPNGSLELSSPTLSFNIWANLPMPSRHAFPHPQSQVMWRGTGVRVV